MSSRWNSAQTPAEPSEPERKGALDVLVKHGFPKRALDVAVANQLHGAGRQMAEQFRAHLLRGDCLFILAGEHGNGKTVAATWWAVERWLERRRQQKAPETAGRYTKFQGLYTEVKDTWGQNARATQRETMVKYQTAAYLVIDECHVRSGGDHGAHLLTSLVDVRYDRRLATVLIANVAPTADAVLAEFGPAIADRANETGGIIPCTWASYRGGAA